MQPCCRRHILITFVIVSEAPDMKLRWLAWATLAVIPVLLVTAAVADVASGDDLVELLAFLVLGLPFAIVGAVVADRQPRQPFGWILLAIGVLLAISTASDALVGYGVEHEGTWVDPGYPALASNVSFSLFLLLLI